ncbi:hypothetical protein HYV89_05575 [Candidatus Woesearchaeota archaeon]|nr:hypothetical protein [Candidatus Woesearchaeota archaeon]
MKYKLNSAMSLYEDLRSEFEILVGDIYEKSKKLEGQEKFIQRIRDDIDLVYLLLDHIESSKKFPEYLNVSNLRHLKHIGNVLQGIELSIEGHVKEGNGTYMQHVENLRSYRESIEDVLGKE